MPTGTRPTRNTTTRDQHRRTLARGRPPCAVEPCLYPDEPIDYNAPHLDPKAYTVDHIIPLAHGGTDTLENKQPSHRACNRAKADRLPDGHHHPAPTWTTWRTW